MKIAHYMEHIWAGGGVASYIRRVALAQRELEHEVRFFDIHAPDREFPAEWLPTRVERVEDMYRLCLDDGVDILHLHYGVDAAPPPGLPTLRTVHGHQPYCPSGGQFLRRTEQPCNRVYAPMPCLLSHLVNRCGSIRPKNLMKSFERTQDELRILRELPTIAVSDFIKNRLIQAGYRAQNIETLYLMAPAAVGTHEVTASEEPRFLYLGRLTPQKGVKWLLRAAAKIRVPFHLDIAGAGYSESECKRLAAQLGLGDTVTFHGWVDADKVAKLLGAARALVFPSLWHEPGGTIAFEAMSHGRPVIMSRVGGMPEVVEDGINGLLVEPGDSDQLAFQMSRLAADAKFAAELGAEGRRIVSQRFGLKMHIDTLMAIYQRARQSYQFR